MIIFFNIIIIIYDYYLLFILCTIAVLCFFESTKYFNNIKQYNLYGTRKDSYFSSVFIFLGFFS